ncbi:MAG TPA: hypothetical protein VN455_09615 [Methanotrichaceae archaeon]|nr:hypothetical protein [Methanotrichaceae archaeon]
MHNTGLLIFALLGALFISGVQGIELSVTAGNGGGTAASGGLDLSAPTDGQVNSITTISFGDSVGLSQAVIGSGNLSEEHVARSLSAGACARVGANVVNADEYDYAYTVHPAEGDPDDGYAHAGETLSANRADAIYAYAQANNSDSLAYTDMYAEGAGKSASVNGYQNSADASAASSATSQKADSIIGDSYFHQEAKSSWIRSAGISELIEQSSAFSAMTAYSGSINDYSDSEIASPACDAVTRNVGLAMGDLAIFEPSALSTVRNASGVLLNTSAVNTAARVDSGIVRNYSETSIAANGTAETEVGLRVRGSSADIRTCAQNNKPAWEGDTNSSGMEIPTCLGFGEFEVKASNLFRESSYSVTAASTPDDIIIKPLLPSGTKTAIILEPYNHIAVDGAKTTDLRGTVFRTLVDSNYAVLRYTDSAVTKSKYSAFDDYNIALTITHMSPTGLDLSTRKDNSSINDEVTASELKSWYASPPGHSFVILAGCDSFGGYNAGTTLKPSPLANALGNASLRAGFTESTGMLWTATYMADLFTNMAQGMTAKDANLAAYDKNADLYGPDKGNAKLWLSGDASFTL